MAESCNSRCCVWTLRSTSTMGDGARNLEAHCHYKNNSAMPLLDPWHAQGHLVSSMLTLLAVYPISAFGLTLPAGDCLEQGQAENSFTVVSPACGCDRLGNLTRPCFDCPTARTHSSAIPARGQALNFFRECSLDVTYLQTSLITRGAFGPKKNSLPVTSRWPNEVLKRHVKQGGKSRLPCASKMR